MTVMTRVSPSGWVLATYTTVVLVAGLLAVTRLSQSLDMPGLAAIELVLLALPWSLALGIEPLSHLGWSGMITIVVTGLLINGSLLRGLTAWLGRRA